MAKYAPEKYWEERLKKDFSLGGVGFLGLGVQYNKWLYKARLRALTKLLKASQINPQGKRILDIGVGTGFYVDYWKERGAKSITGIDITEKSISMLKTKYPGYEFIKADISSKELSIKEKFDVITAFDVLFHIVEEAKFEQAIANIRKLSHQETQILITDSFLKEPRPSGFHEYDRTMDGYKEALIKTELEPVITMPIFYYMNNPIDKNRLNSRLLRSVVSMVWRLIAMLPLLRRLGAFGEAIGYLVGLILYMVDGITLRYAKDGPSSKLLLAQLEDVEGSKCL
ncbi:MAG: class I SAM-dependent methyltransferase [Dehalococcoidia bacterium]|nr:class I SAM-dependent methyltransferase [Dehalococcoidia bacterium]